MGRTALIAFLLIVVTASTALAAAGPKFFQTYGNKHNLRGNPANTVTYKAAYDPADRRTDEICIFCHTPHNATPGTPLWGRKSTTVSSFGHYTSPNLKLHTDSTASTDSAYNEPNGSSRLCLSCHDGATALGAVLNGPEIPFDPGNDKIAPGGHNVFNPSLGEQDATQHHHPISFKFTATVRDRLNALENGGGNYYKLPTEDNFPPGGGSGYQRNEVKLDRNGYMQCATCHNPHQNMSGDDRDAPESPQQCP